MIFERLSLVLWVSGPSLEPDMIMRHVNGFNSHSGFQAVKTLDPVAAVNFHPLRLANLPSKSSGQQHFLEDLFFLLRDFLLRRLSLIETSGEYLL